MRELSLHILDIVENSVKANATLVQVDIEVKDGYLYITVVDNGKGMSEEFLAKVVDPFTTTRKTRKVGLGIPLIKQSAELAEGEFSITSKLGEGTTVRTSYKLDSIDRVPLGDVPETITTLLYPDVEFVWRYAVNGEEFIFDTREVKEELQGVPIDSPEILVFLKSLLKENIDSINGGITI